MSSRSNSDSEEEDAQDLLNRIKKNLNNDNSDEEVNSEDEQDSNSSKENNSQKSKEEQADNIVVNDNENEDSQKVENNEIKETQSPTQSQKQKLELKQQSSSNQNQVISNKPTIQQDNQADADEDEVESGLNIKKILSQNGINIENDKDLLIEEQKQQSREDKQQDQQTASQELKQKNQEINVSSPKKNQIVQNAEESSQQSQQNEPSSQMKENILTVIRVDAEKKEEVDHMIQELENIKLKKPLLEDPEIINFKIDSSHLEQTMEQVKKKYDENVSRYMLKQKGIFDKIKEINKRSANIYENVNSSNKTFVKKKISDKEKYIKDVQKLQNESSKTKTFLIMMIQRLEAIELEIDKFTVAKLKQMSSNEDPSNQSQQVNNNPQQNNQTN